MPNNRVNIKMNPSGMRKLQQEIQTIFEMPIEVDLEASHEEQKRQVKRQLQSRGIDPSPEMVQQLIDEAK